jgi:flagellar export protein FliJ
VRSRSARFDKLLSLRQRELDQQKVALAKANELLRKAEQATLACQDELRHAARLHRGDGAPRTAEELRESSDWLRDRVLLLEKRMQEENLRRTGVQQATVQMQRAEREKRKIELVIERILAEEAAEKTREDQRQTDELAQLKLHHRGRLA